MVDIAVKVQLGFNFKDQGLKNGWSESLGYVAVKAPVFSFSKLKGVDPVLGPEMKSTGEQIGLGLTIEEALTKALSSKESELFKPTSNSPMVLCSFSDRDKGIGKFIAEKMHALGYTIMATPGTAQFLQKVGISAKVINKNKDSLRTIFTNGCLHAVINSPTQGGRSETLGFYLRECAIHYQIPLFTCLDTAKALLNLKNSVKLTVSTIEEYRKTPPKDKRSDQLCTKDIPAV